MQNIHILWADDEIDLLKPHIMFLEDKGYTVITAQSGDEALEYMEHREMDIVFLDENMPGLSGLETLAAIKGKYPNVPVVMITKSEEEYIMEDAIGSKISDYLIKPVNPSQILLSVKKNIESRRLVQEKNTQAYRRTFGEISLKISDNPDGDEWIEIYRQLIHWQIELDRSGDEGMREVLAMQFEEANRAFCKFYSRNYLQRLRGGEGPALSHEVLPAKLFPLISEQAEKPLVLICIDDMRYDQFKAMEPLLLEFFRKDEEDAYFSIIPTATSFSRSALFAALMPSEIENRFGKQWEEGSDEHRVDENTLLQAAIKLHDKDIKSVFLKVSNLEEGKKLSDRFHDHLHQQLIVISYNFMDMMAHSKAEMDVIKELADTEAAYRSLARSWFEHSPLLEIMRKAAEKGCRLAITTDHGSVRVKNDLKVVGDRHTNTNLRYKYGRNLNYNPKEVFAVDRPEDAKLPRFNVSTKYIFALNQDFFVYPNNYHHFAGFYKNTFQHGGISMEEIILPFAVYSAR
jgi:CheY-like chemotaxis protein